MSQVTDFDVPSSPLTMAALAVALEAVFAALGSINRGATAPSNPFEGMLWWDSAATVEILKRYTVTAGWVSILSVNRSTGALAIIGATDAATVSTLMQRDSAGRAKVVAPSVAADIALKSTVTADIATHDALVTAHSALMTGSSASATDGSSTFTAGTIYWSKIGDEVLISWTGLTHASSSVASATDIIPSSFRPTSSCSNLVYMDATGITRVIISFGSLQVQHMNWSGSGVNKTSVANGSVSFIVP